MEVKRIASLWRYLALNSLVKCHVLKNGDKNEESSVDVHDDVSWDSTSLVGTVHDQALVEREDMLVRRVVIDSLVEVDDSQRDNLFYTRCMVFDRMYTTVVNGASCDKFLMSATLVKELKVEDPNILGDVGYNGCTIVEN